MWQVKFLNEAKKDLAKLDNSLKGQVLKGIAKVRTNPLPVPHGYGCLLYTSSFLSQILQENVPEKYYLSQRACSGILRRSSVRGKELPELLKRALEKQAQYV